MSWNNITPAWKLGQFSIHHKLQARIRKQRDLLDECERAFEFIARGDCGCDECNKARDTLAKLRGQEKADD